MREEGGSFRMADLLKLQAGLQRNVDIEKRVDQVERAARKIFRAISDTERLNFSLDYVFLDERVGWLEEERRRLDAKYKELKAAIIRELSECEREKARLLSAMRYGEIAEPVSEEAAAAAAAPTNLLTPSQELQQQQQKQKPGR